MTIRKFTNRLLMLYGIPPHLDGFAYIIDSVEKIYLEPDSFHGITKTVYPYVGNLYGVDWRAVEKDIRIAVAVSGIELSNKKFLAMVLRVYEGCEDK